jgi:Cu2+-exporting ATPase
MKIGAISYLSYSPLTTSALVIYEPIPGKREAVMAALLAFQPRGFSPLSIYAEQEIGVGEEKPLPLNPVSTYILKRIFIPYPIRVAWNILSAVPIVLRGLKFLLWHKRMTVEVLDAAALSVCYLRQDFKSAGTLLFFFSLSTYLEAWTRRRSLTGLFHSLLGEEEKVWIKGPEGEEIMAPESALSEGSLVIVRAGGAIPVDGLVQEGLAMVNQATMTGEPLPVRKEKGGAVFAGTAVEEGQIIIKATKVGGNTRIRSIIQYIKESEASKTGLQGRAERMADAIVPFNFLLAGLVFLITRDPLKAGNVLLVDYSCAIRLSTPLVVLSAMREGNDRGILIKGGRYLEEMARAKIAVFDKTGTLTEARPLVAEVVAFPPHTQDDILRLAACLEEHFPHPVGRAVVREAKKEGLRHEEEHTSVNYVLAHGISSTWRGHKVLLGSRHFVADDEGIAVSPEQAAKADALTADGSSLIYMAFDDKLAAFIVIKDKIRKGARETLEAIKSLGIEETIMLTGDLEATAASMAKEIGFDRYRSELLPDQKADVLKELSASGRPVMMVGDGLNDSAALSLANVGVALSDGSELAKDVANVQLLKGRIGGLADARLLSQRAVGRIGWNYRLIVGLNSLFLGLGLFGLAGPSLTAMLHNATTVMVAYRGTRPMLKANEPTLARHFGEDGR